MEGGFVSSLMENKAAAIRGWLGGGLRGGKHIHTFSPLQQCFYNFGKDVATKAGRERKFVWLVLIMMSLGCSKKLPS